MMSRAKLSKGLTKSNSHWRRSALSRARHFPGHSDHELGHPVIAELRWPVVAGVQDHHDVITRCLEDLILLEGWVKVCGFQLVESAEGPWDKVIIEVHDDASMFEGVDNLGLENSASAASGETERSGEHRYTSDLIDILVERASWDDSIRVVGQVSGSFGGGA